jgi:hypothetical protein
VPCIIIAERKVKRLNADARKEEKIFSIFDSTIKNIILSAALNTTKYLSSSSTRSSSEDRGVVFKDST